MRLALLQAAGRVDEEHLDELVSDVGHRARRRQDDEGQCKQQEANGAFHGPAP
ncbi:MAG: hypothetical protein QNL91_06680 [Candidatus Krumholzibacteria bacterium]|nr:hypothetical protein [Candidatus Krumholzibacteria bacterium]